MQTPTPIRHAEQGYILVAVIFLLALLTLSLAVAVPRVAKQLQRDRELETMRRGKQYIRGIKLYYAKFGSYPPTVDALVQTSSVRFLRKKYTDPTTGKADWKPILFGQNKVPTVMGFFGQPLAGATVAGIGPTGGNPGGGPGGTTTSTDASSASSTSTTASTSATGTSTDSSTSSSTDTSSTGPSGPTFGGAGIIGFSPNSPKQSILVYKKKNHYNEWEFVYDPLSDQVVVSGGNTGTVGQPASSTSTPVGGTSGTTTTPTTN